jgi:hypothetical protein
MCGCHETSNNEQPTSHQHIYVFVSSVAELPRLLHPIHRRASVIESAGLWNPRPQRSYTGRERIRFLGSDLCDCSLASSSSSSRLVYLFVGHVPRVIAFSVNSVRHNVVFTRSSSSRNHKSRMIFPLKSCLTY